jgi:soluble lytic murein transglycosylase-like protein
MIKAGWLLIPLLALSCLPGGEMAAMEQAATTAPSRNRFTPLIDRIAKRYGLDAALVHAVVKVESNYNPKAISTAGAIGLMQLMPKTAEDYGVTSREALFNPEINVKTGTRHLKRLLKKYKNISRALEAYNAGEGVTKGFRKSGAYLETRKYVVRVIQYYQKYKQRYK